MHDNREHAQHREVEAVVDEEPSQVETDFERVVAGPYWPAFGFIAAENDLVRLGSVPPAIAP
jgi:hypothetical protein